jgi:hypothetical protein
MVWIFVTADPTHRGHGFFSLVPVFVLSGRGLCDGPIPHPEESYRLWYVSECDQVKIKTLDTCCEQVGRRGKDYERKIFVIHYFAYIYALHVKLWRGHVQCQLSKRSLLRDTCITKSFFSVQLHKKSLNHVNFS